MPTNGVDKEGGMLPNLSNENSGDRDVHLATAPSTTRSRSALETRKGVAVVGDEGGAGGDGDDVWRAGMEYTHVVAGVDFGVCCVRLTLRGDGYA